MIDRDKLHQEMLLLKNIGRLMELITKHEVYDQLEFRKDNISDYTRIRRAKDNDTVYMNDLKLFCPSVNAIIHLYMPKITRDNCSIDYHLEFTCNKYPKAGGRVLTALGCAHSDFIDYVTWLRRVKLDKENNV